MDNFIEKTPNWIRYILAIPFGIICLIIVYYIGYFSNLYIASPDSLCMKVYTFFYNNGINVFIMISAMNYILPKYQFKFTLVISIIFCALGFVGLGMNILIQNVTIYYMLGFILTFIAFIYCCYYTYKTYEKNDVLDINNKYETLGNIIMKGLNESSIDNALLTTYQFYEEQGIDLSTINIKDDNKYRILSLITMMGLGTNDIDEAIKQTTIFYKEQGINVE